MKISVFGSGYVGLVQAAVLAEVGHDVVCMDIDERKVDSLRQGQVSIFEPGLAALVREGLEAGRLHFTCDEQLAVQHGQVLFIAVGTPLPGRWQCRPEPGAGRWRGRRPLSRATAHRGGEVHRAGGHR
ncbi:UDP-glucose 6-dehydrogenase [Pseudomonas sp. R151218B TE3479]